MEITKLPETAFPQETFAVILNRDELEALRFACEEQLHRAKDQLKRADVNPIWKDGALWLQRRYQPIKDALRNFLVFCPRPEKKCD